MIVFITRKTINKIARENQSCKRTKWIYDLLVERFPRGLYYNKTDLRWFYFKIKKKYVGDLDSTMTYREIFVFAIAMLVKESYEQKDLYLGLSNHFYTDSIWSAVKDKTFIDKVHNRVIKDFKKLFKEDKM